MNIIGAWKEELTFFAKNKLISILTLRNAIHISLVMCLRPFFVMLISYIPL